MQMKNLIVVLVALISTACHFEVQISGETSEVPECTMSWTHQPYRTYTDTAGTACWSVSKDCETDQLRVDLVSGSAVIQTITPYKGNAEEYCAVYYSPTPGSYNLVISTETTTLTSVEFRVAEVP
jgi:hypothetical protein